MTYWISFADEHLERHLGVIITDGENEEAALAFLKANNLCPGGQAMFYEMPVETEPDAKAEVERWGKNRLISAAELAAAFYLRVSELPEDIKAIVEQDRRVTIVCGKHT